MKEANETRKRKRYMRPQLRTVTIEFGVYGCYGGESGDKGDVGFSTGWLYKS